MKKTQFAISLSVRLSSLCVCLAAAVAWDLLHAVAVTASGETHALDPLDVRVEELPQSRLVLPAECVVHVSDDLDVLDPSVHAHARPVA